MPEQKNSRILFLFDQRLGLFLPSLQGTWKELRPDIQEEAIAAWEAIRGTIPDIIKKIETEITAVHEQLIDEEDFERSCELNVEIAELASKINDLWIWFRLTPSITS